MPTASSSVHAGYTDSAVRDASVPIANCIAAWAASLGQLAPAQVYKGTTPTGGADRDIYDGAINRSDHAAFQQQGYGAALACEDFFANLASEPGTDPNPNYHEQADTVIDVAYATDITCAVAQAVRARRMIRTTMLQTAFGPRSLGLLAALVVGCSSGLRGRAYEREANGGIGPTIAGVTLSFVKEDGTSASSATTGADGSYSVGLSAGRYYVLASHANYEDYNTAPGFSVVSGTSRRTMNVFLRDPAVTTVIIVRHGEKLNPDSDVPEEPLSPAGEVRAAKLRENLLRAGITAVYATNTVRTQATVGPTAALFRLPTETYSTPTALGSTILTQHRGDVVLVAAHSNTVAAVANAVGAAMPTATIGDYDNLYVVSVTAAAANGVNLQYGVVSTPDVTKNDLHATTFLLVGDAPAGSPLGQELLHAAQKSTIAAIHTNGTNGLVEPLATALGITPTTYASTDMPTVISNILAAHPQGVVLVAGTNNDLRAAVQALGAQPTPVLYTTDTDHLVIVTRFASGATRTIPIRF